MPDADPATCSARSLAAAEPLPGTASRVRHWLMVEQPGPWGHDALAESDLPREVGARLAEEGERLGVRVLLIKRRDRERPEARRCFASFTGRRERRLVTFEVGDARDLMGLDLRRHFRERWAGLGEAVAGPLFLVCTHGKHDPCCAREGGPVARALAARPEVWEATHVGGDRFAGNVVAFPHGLYFGRVTRERAPGIVEAYAAGRIALPTYRGRSAHPPAVQAAEHHLRRETGLEGVDDLVPVSHEAAGATQRVGFLVPGGATRIVEVEESRLDPRPLTCKAGRPGRPRDFVVRSLT